MVAVGTRLVPAQRRALLLAPLPPLRGRLAPLGMPDAVQRRVRAGLRRGRRAQRPGVVPGAVRHPRPAGCWLDALVHGRPAGDARPDLRHGRPGHHGLACLQARHPLRPGLQPGQLPDRGRRVPRAPERSPGQRPEYVDGPGGLPALEGVSQAEDVHRQPHSACSRPSCWSSGIRSARPSGTTSSRSGSRCWINTRSAR